MAIDQIKINSIAYDIGASASNISFNKNGTSLDATNVQSAIVEIDGDVSALGSNKVDKVSGKDLSTNDYTDADKAKLEGISAQANRTTVTQVQESGDTSKEIAQIGLDGETTSIYADDAKKVIESCYEEKTVTGNPIAIKTISGSNAKALTVTMNPIQDLHGYDNPWVGGAGKNKIPLTVSEIKAANTNGGTWSGNEYTWNGVSYTILTDDDENVIGIDLYGTASANSTLYIQANNVDANLTQGRYSFSSGTSGSSSTTSRCYIEFYNTETSSWSGIATDTASPTYETNKFRNCRIQVYTGTQFDHKVYKPQLESGTSTTTFAPYSNICPISGRTEASVTRTGKNILYKTIEGVTIGTNGGISTNSSYNVVIAQVLQGMTYTFSINGVASVAVRSFFTAEPASGSSSYNEERYTTDNTFVSPITGYVAIRTSTNATNIQLENGSQATEYTPYAGTETITIQLGQTVYGGTLDLTSGKLTIDRVKHILSASDTIGLTEQTTNTTRVGFLLSDAKSVIARERMNFLCNNGVYSSTFISNTAPVYSCGLYTTGGNTYFLYHTEKVDNYNTAKANIIASGTEVSYYLATPTTISTSAEEITLLKGNNVLSTNADDMELSYQELPDITSLAQYVQTLEARIKALEEE